MSRELDPLIEQERENSLAAYECKPGWLVEHFGIEQNVIGSGYEYRQVLELVQNAADAILESASEGNADTPRIEVRLENDYLYAANTGAPISRDGIDALLDSHRSSKRQNQIGRFGLGFKSLLRLGGRIDVCSKTVAFTFDPERCRNEVRERFNGRYDPSKTPGLRLAWAMEDGDVSALEAGFPWATTVIRTQVLDDNEQLLTKLRETILAFPVEFLLFLPVSVDLHLKDGVHGDRLLKSVRTQTETSTYSVALHDGDSCSQWQVIENLVPVGEQGALQDATDIHARSEVPIAWAIALNRKREETGRFWAFFPTAVPSRIPGILNAPWKVDSARDTIIPGDWNQGLMEHAAKLVVSHLPKLWVQNDAGKPLDYFPRQLDGQDDVAKPLVESVWAFLKEAPAIPDATEASPLRNGAELLRHPVSNTEIAAAWTALADSSWRSQMVHPSCYVGDRTSRLAEFARRLRLEANHPDQAPNLREQDAVIWFAAICSKEPSLAVQVLKLAEDYSVQRSQPWRNERQQLRIIPTEDGHMCGPDQVYLAPSADGAPAGIPLVAGALAEVPEAQRLLRDVMKVRVLDDAQWLLALNIAMEAIAAPQSAEQAWRELWHKLRSTPEAVRERFLVQSGRKMRVRRLDGCWMLSDQALLPGRLVAGDNPSEANCNLLVDVEMHRGDAKLLEAIGLTDFPHGDCGPGSYRDLLKEHWSVISSWLHFCRGICLETNPNNPADAGFLEPKEAMMPRGWMLLPCLRGWANAELTAKMLPKLLAPGYGATMTFAHRTNIHYPPTAVPHLLLWLLSQHGLLVISDRAVRLVALVKHRRDPAASLVPDWERLSPWLDLLAGAKPEVPATEQDSQELWQALIRHCATPEALSDDNLRHLWTAAARHGVVPTALPVPRREMALQEVYVTESAELARRGRSGGKLALTLDGEAATLWMERGAKRLDALLRPDYESESPLTALADVFPELQAVLQGSVSATCCCVTNLRLILDHAGEPVPCLHWDGKLLVDRVQLSRMPRSEMLKLLLSELAGAGWLKCASEEAHRELWDGQVEERRSRVRDCATLPERLYKAVGETSLPLLEVLGRLRDKPFLTTLNGAQLAGVLLALHGPASLSKLHKALEGNGLKPPGRWSSDEARAFVASIGFGTEYATSSSSRREAEEFISGPIKLKPLHDYQDEVYQELGTLVNIGCGRRRAVVSLPTGAGKTRVLVQASVELVLKSDHSNPTVLWIAQTDELCEQAVQAYRQVWINLGSHDTDLRICRLWAGKADPREPEPGKPCVVVASIQTLSGRVGNTSLNWLNCPGMMVIDECHHATTKSYTRVLHWLGVEGGQPIRGEQLEPVIIGLSATPFRGDDMANNRWLANRFDNKLIPSRQSDLHSRLRADGVLAREDYEAIDLPNQLPDELRKRLEELQQKIVAEEMPEGVDVENLLEEINQKLAVDEIRNQSLLNRISAQVEAHPQTSILFFANSVLHGEEMAARLHLENIPAAVISGETPSTARREFLKGFKDGRIKILCNHSVLTTGFDAPKTDMILIARQVFSRVRYMQMVGRGLRGPKNGGTERCMIVTVNDNLGRFDNHWHWEYLRNLWQ